MFSLHPGSGIPIYRQLVEQVRRLIAGGQLPPGAELPSVRDLAVQYAVNPMTISKAYACWRPKGLLERNRGKPMTVAAGRAAGQPFAAPEAAGAAGAAAGAVRAAAGTDPARICDALIDRIWERRDE